ncbi:MAG: NAD-dependent epimerase/dehydratase family protein [Byssovorax sp.]
MENRPALVVLGCGFTGVEAARLARAEGREVLGSTRSSAHAAELAALGIEARVLPRLDAAAVRELVPAGADVLITFPPDGATDALIAPALGAARALVYISSTAVYGDAAGEIDERVPVDPSAPRASARLAAEEAYRAQGGVILRSAAIYGPGRGLHVRLARGEHRLAEDGLAVVSRIHVTDLARLALAALDRGPRCAIFNAADAAPVPQIEVITWLAARLGVPVPPSVPPETLHETLRHDRAVDGSLARRTLGVDLVYPSYLEGFAACLAPQREALR